MDFVDNTGHIFSLPQFEEFPFGYEYNENLYTFWIDAPNTNRLSVDNYYMRTIYFLLPYNVTDYEKENAKETWSGSEDILDRFFEIEITINSGVYSLVSTKHIQEQLESFTSIHDKININLEDNIVKTLTNEDLYGIIVDESEYIDNAHNFLQKKFLLIPIYVIGKASIEGSWSTNILIHVKENEDDPTSTEYEDEDVPGPEYWCPITVGGQWAEENEILMINGQNMGITLPLDIMKAIYQAPFENSVFNEQLWNEKIKEYLLNYMGIKGEIGNFNSAINSLNWFGYNNLIDISTLLRTDNEYKKQYVKDFFDINTDILESFSTFHNSSMLSLVMKLNQETGESTGFDFKGDMWGEDNPVLEDLMDKIIPVKLGINEPSTYWKPYYNFSFIELGLKLSALKYYYDKYFLPIHMSVNSATLQHKVYANDLKLINKTNEHIVENIIFLPYKNEVEFPSTNVRLFTQQIHYVDDNFNEFEDITEHDNWYYINDSCVSIPIKFTQYEDKDSYYDCVLILEKINTTDNIENTSNYINSNIPDSTVIYETHFTFTQKANSDPTTIYHDFVIYPKMLTDFLLKRDTNQLYKDKLTSIYYWINSEFLLRLLVNNRWYTYRFKIKLPDLRINIGTLHYKYWEDDIQFSSKFRQLKKLPGYNGDDLVFNGFMYEPKLAEVNNINFFKDFISYLKLEEQKYVSKEFFTNNSLIYYFIVNGQKIIINRNLINDHKTLYIPYKFLNEDNLYTFKYANLTVFLTEKGDKVLKVLNIEENAEEILVDENSFVDRSAYLVLKYDPEKQQYYAVVDGENVYIEMYELLYNTIENFLGDYTEQKNIVNNDKYKNQIHIYDLYRRERVINHNIWQLHNNIDVRCKSIRFIHNNYTNNTFYIQGRIHDLQNKIADDINRVNDNVFNTHDDYTIYSIFWNDKLSDYDNLEPTGYVYYLASDRQGNITGEYAEAAITEGFDYIKLGTYDFIYNDFISFNEVEGDKYIIYNQGTRIICKGKDNNDFNDYVHGVEYSEVVYKVKFKECRINGEIRYYDFIDVNYQDFEQKFIDNTDTNTPWKIEITFYYKRYYTIQNVEINYEGEVFKKYKELNGVNTEEIDYYYGKINEKVVKLTPYYNITQFRDTSIPESEYDPDIENFVLKNQPARHWYNIDTYDFNVKLKDSIDQVWLDEESSNFNLDEYSSDWLEKWSYIYDDDISYKNYLEVNISNYINGDNWYMLEWDAKIQLEGEDEKDWDNIYLSIYELNEHNELIKEICSEKNTIFRVEDYNPDSKYVAFIQIDNLPGEIGKIFRATFTPHIYEVYDEYQKLKYEDYVIKDDNIIEYDFRGKHYRYGMNNGENTKELYKEFFHMEPYEYTQDNKHYKYNILLSNIDINTRIDYDQYLMHDDKYWYLVYISTKTTDHFTHINDTKIDKIINFDGYENVYDESSDVQDYLFPLNLYINDGENYVFNENYDRKYQLRLISSSKEFLPNRYYFESSNGVNHFNSDDLIAATLENNERLPVIIHNSCKWKISPYSVDLQNDTTTESNAEMVILNTPDNKNNYDRGYYTVSVKYSANGYTTQQWNRNALIRID